MARVSTSAEGESDLRPLQAERYEVLIKEGATASGADPRGDEGPTTLRQNSALLERLRLLAMASDEVAPAGHPAQDDEAPHSAQPLLLQRPILSRSSRARLEGSAAPRESSRALQEPTLRSPGSGDDDRSSVPTRVEPSSREGRPRTRRWQSDGSRDRAAPLALSRSWWEIGHRALRVFARFFRRSPGDRPG